MSNLSWNEIQDRAGEFSSKWQGATYEKGDSHIFWSEFLNIFGVDHRRYGAFFEHPIKKLDKSQGFIDMFWPGKVLVEHKSFGRSLGAALEQAYDYLPNIADHDLPQAIIVCDFDKFEVNDLNTREKTTFVLKDLSKHVHEFAFLIEQANRKSAEENPVNRKAAEAMASLHNELRDTGYKGRDLELLLVRLVFCMFADDSGIFENGIFEEYTYNRTEIDGSDLGPRIIRLFEVLNTKHEERSTILDESLAAFEYINGGLFKEPIKTPDFNHKMRDALLDAMKLDWSKVSPAIFGSMFQGVMDEKQRRDLGAHYTSEVNILKVIKPLFLDDLYAEFAMLKSGAKLREFQDKLASLTFLDPACGCGNFLVITYRELRRLEHKVLERLYGKRIGMFDIGSTGLIQLDVNQMYGIEIEEFPSLIAQTALWLTDHQMNMEFSAVSGKAFKRIPLTTSATIVCANALKQDWADVIEPKNLRYILGNPPFIGKNQRTLEQSDDMETIFEGMEGWKSLDFVSNWYVRAARYIKNNPEIQVAFVSTNSITQGEQVPVLWPFLKSLNVEINFAHKTFRWTNDAKGVAAVHCVIIGFSLTPSTNKKLFNYVNGADEAFETSVSYINVYLFDGPDVIIYPSMKPICKVSPMINGSKPADGGHLLLSFDEREELLKEEPHAQKWLRKVMGAEEFLNNIKRYCLWLVDCPPDELRNMPKVLKRVEDVRNMRLASKKSKTRELASSPMFFAEIRVQQSGEYLLVPKVTSERRRYSPIGFISHKIIATDRNHTIPNATKFEFGILSSLMHMCWLSTLCGRMKSDFNYSSKLVYNTFPWPQSIPAEKKQRVEQLADKILVIRALHTSSTLADLYDPLSMPMDLLKAHRELDRAVDGLYRREDFLSDEDRIAFLFQEYAKVTTN